MKKTLIVFFISIVGLLGFINMVFAKENDTVNIRKTINKYKSAPIEREKYESINDFFIS